MYVYIHNPRCPLPCWRGGQTEAHAVQKKNIGHAERAADNGPTTPKGVNSAWHTLWELRKQDEGNDMKCRGKKLEPGVALLWQNLEGFLLLGYYSAHPTHGARKDDGVHK